MKLLLFFLIVLSGFSSSLAQDVCHFNSVDIPRSEARLLELVRVVEFRAECVLPRLDSTTQFIAERYQDGKCISRHCFSLGKYSDSSDGTYKGVISFGWHMDDHKLVGVHDTGYFHQSGFVEMLGFEATTHSVSFFFKDSLPEARKSRRGLHFDLYPIFCLRSEPGTARPAHLPKGVPVSGRTGTTRAPSQEGIIKSFQNAPDAIIVYLSFGAGMPDLDYDK